MLARLVRMFPGRRGGRLGNSMPLLMSVGHKPDKSRVTSPCPSFLSESEGWSGWYGTIRCSGNAKGDDSP